MPSVGYADADLIPLSALQHFLYCPRQCALIHVDQQWAENRYTAEGRVLHERTDSGVPETRSGMRIERRVAIRSSRLGVSGYADVVEVDRKNGIVRPVEYKRGRPKSHRADEVQLCAQAVCLEEMLGEEVVAGSIFYGRSRRRLDVEFDHDLRRLTEETATATHRLLRGGEVPAPLYEARKCEPCSLVDICRPRELAAPSSVREWLAAAVAT